MRILTARKRAEGLGAAKSGTGHHWSMIVTSGALLGLIPAFVLTFGQALGGTHDEVIAYYQRPFPAIVAILTFLVGFVHFRKGVQTMIEDYVHGTRQKVLIVLAICLSYAAAATGIFAVAKIAL